MDSNLTVGFGSNSRGIAGGARAVLFLLAVGALASGCQKSAADNPPAAGPQAMPVQVQIAPAVKISDTTEYLSILKSRHSAAINPQVEGQITRILVKSGDHVVAMKEQTRHGFTLPNYKSQNRKSPALT